MPVPVLTSVFGVPGLWRRSTLGSGLVAALTVGLSGVLVVPQAAAVEPVDEPVSCVGVERTAPDTASAMLNARLSACPVEDLSQRNEFGSVYALPNGQWTMQRGSGPAWVRTGGDGTSEDDWAQVDLTLTVGTDGVVRPVAAMSGLEIAGAVDPAEGETVALASVTDPQSGVVSSVEWAGALPDPVLEGKRATFAGVAVGLDLVIEATNTGFEQFFVAHTEAAVQAAVADPLLVTSDGGVLSATEDGGLEVTAPSGEVVGLGATPLAWDARAEEYRPDSLLEPAAVVDPDAPRLAPLPDMDVLTGKVTAVAGSSGGTGALDAGVQRPTALEADPLSAAVTLGESVQVTSESSAEVTLSGAEQLAADPDTVFPVVIDPQVNLNWGMDLYVQSDTTVDTSARTYMQMGTFNGGGVVARSIVNFPTSAIAGKQVTAATMELWNFHSYSCSARNWEVWHTGGISTATRWSGQPSWFTRQLTTSATKGYSSSCAGGWVNADVTGAMQYAANRGDSQITLGMRAENESDSYGWKKFYAADNGSYIPSVWVTYNSYPNTPGTSSIPAGQYNWYPSYGDPNQVLYVKTTKPTISSVVSDLDGGNVKAQFDVLDGSTLVWNKETGTTVASGGTSTFTPTSTTPALTHGKTYTSRSWANDGSLTSTSSKALWTFIVDTSAPAAPSVTATGYTDGQWKDTKPASNTFTFQSTSTDVYRFEYSLDGGPWTAMAASGATPTATFDWNPDNGAHTVKVRSFDKAAWASAETTFGFGAGGAALSGPVSGLKSTDVFTVKASAPPAGSGTVTPSIWWRVAGTAEAGDYDGSKGSTTGWTKSTDLPVVPTGSAVSVSKAWSAAAAAQTLGKSRVPVVLDVQVCFTYTSPAVTRCTWTADTTSRSTVVRVPHAFGDNFPTAAAGPGQVALWTGEFNASTTDVSVPGYVGDLSVSRTYSSQAGSEAGVFGPGWRASFDGTDVGIAGFQVADSTDVDGTFALVDDEGGALVFRQPGNTKVAMKTGTYAAVDSDTAAVGAKLVLTGTGTAARLTFTQDDGTATVFAFTGTNAAGERVWSPESVTEPGSVGSTTFTRDASGKVMRILAPVPPGVTCPATGDLNPGCRAVNVIYGATTTGTEVTGQVKEISYTAYDPDKAGGAGMVTVVVARYEYDSAGRLAKVIDPRTGLSTSYAYSGTSSSGQPLLTGVTPSGLAGYTLQYGSTTQDSAALTTVTRDAPVSGGPSVLLSRFVYGISPATAVSGLPSMTGADVAVWGQTTVPAYGAAVFSADRAASVAGSGVGDVTAADWPYADLQYTDADGRVTNTAAYGAGDWQVTATRYDAGGRVIHELDQKATAQLSALHAAQGAQAAAVIDSYATITRYNGDITAPVATTWEGGTIASGTVLTQAGTLVTDVWLPARETPSGITRAHMHTDYDQGAPNQGVDPETGIAYRMATAVVALEAGEFTGSSVLSVPVATGEPVVSQLLTGYDPIDGSSVTGAVSGWTLGAATTTTTVMGAGKDDIIASVRYDVAGQVVAAHKPGSNGTDAATELNGYYTATAQTGVFAECGGKPEWAGLDCQTRTAEATPTLPIERTTKYSMYLTAATTTETRDGVTRTSTTQFDAAGRPVLSSVSVTGLPGSTAVPSTRTERASTSGLTTATVTVNADGTEAGRTTNGYDMWGRQTTYTNAEGEVTTTTYDTMGRATKVVDPLRTVEYEYDTTTEHRGYPTVARIPGVGQFTASYDASGAMTSQSLLGGRVTQHLTYNRVGGLTGMKYTGAPLPSEPEQDLLAWTIESDLQGRTTTMTSVSGTGADGLSRTQQFSYDRAEELVSTTDKIGSTCTQRNYGFGARGNRTTQAAVTLDPECGGTAITTTSKSWVHDTADRVQAGATVNGTTSTVYMYDELGRQTAIPAVDTPSGTGDVNIGYYDTDAARTLTQAGVTTTYTLDPARRRALATTSGPSGTTTLARHYTDGSDNPGYVVKTTQEGNATTWYGASIRGDLGLEITTNSVGATDSTLTLADPLGSIATTIKLPAVTEPLQLGAVSTWDEYGNTISPGGTTGPVRYGWLGARERALDDTRLILMGVRIYNSITGLFTSVDPIEGGNTTSYAYPQDPVNYHDVSGMAARLISAWAAGVVYSLTFDIGQTFRYASQIFSSFKSRFNRYFPIPGAPSVLRLGARMNLRAFGKMPAPVKVTAIGSTWWMFTTLPGHFDGVGQISFYLNKVNGHLRLTIVGVCPACGTYPYLAISIYTWSPLARNLTGLL